MPQTWGAAPLGRLAAAGCETPQKARAARRSSPLPAPLGLLPCLLGLPLLLLLLLRLISQLHQPVDVDATILAWRRRQR